MTQFTHISHAVIVLGDRETVARADLAEKAAEQGAVIAETYSFDPGEAGACDDLADLEPVVAAMSRAIATGSDLWLPFPLADLGREEHLRRVSLVLQRRGLNVVLGRDLEPSTTDGGLNPADFALRNEVRAVDALDHAVIATCGASVLAAEIERELAGAAAERFCGAAEVARLFGKSVHWVYRGVREGLFTAPDGTPVEPQRAGRSGRLRFSLPVLREMARSCHRRGLIGEAELRDLLDVLEGEF
jgi:hypothetical protein